MPSSPSFKRWLLPWPRSIASRSLAAAALGNRPWHTPWPRSRVCGTSRWTAWRGFQGGRIVIARSSRQCCPSRSKRRRHTEGTQSSIPCTGFRAHNYTTHTHTHTYCRHMDTNLRTYIHTYIHIHTHRCISTCRDTYIEYSHIRIFLLRAARQAQGGFTIDGNYFNATGGFVWDEVEVVVWLDLDFWVVLTRAVWRTLKRMICRIECCNGNYEHPGLLFTGDSVITWVIKVHHLQEEKLRRMREKHQHQPFFVRIRCPQDVDRLVQLVRSEVGL